MNYEELEEVLELAELSPYQADLYTSLFLLGDAAITEIIEACTVPQPRVYDVVRDLENKGYVETYEQEKLRARVCDPAPLVERLRTRATSFQDAADKLESEWQNPNLEKDKVSVFTKYHTTLSEAMQEIATAQHHVEVALSIEELYDFLDVLQSAKSNGAVVQISLYASSDTLLSSLDAESDFSDAATEIRHRESPSPFIALLDGEVAYLGLNNPPINEYGMLINDHIMSSLLHWYFHVLLWENLAPLVVDQGSVDAGLYIDIRECIRDVKPRLERGESVPVVVTGFNTQTNEQVELRGEIVDAVHPRVSGESDDDGDPMTDRRLVATLVMETADGTYTVGGIGAVIEDIRATKIQVDVEA